MAGLGHSRKATVRRTTKVASVFDMTALNLDDPECARTFSVMMAASLAVRTRGVRKGPAGVFRRDLGVRAGGVVVSLT
jgi:hypothetical protein